MKTKWKMMTLGERERVLSIWVKCIKFPTWRFRCLLLHFDPVISAVVATIISSKYARRIQLYVGDICISFWGQHLVSKSRKRLNLGVDSGSPLGRAVSCNTLLHGAVRQKIYNTQHAQQSQRNSSSGFKLLVGTWKFFLLSWRNSHTFSSLR